MKTTGVNRRWMILLAFALLCAASRLATGWTPAEDAYISFRYAANAAMGHGFVFNPGERVEGVTNLLWTALLAVFSLGHGSRVPDVALAFELLLACATIVILWRWTKNPIPVLLLAVFPGFFNNICSGLAVGLEAFLLTGAAYSFFYARRPLIGSVAVGLAFATRPDSLIAGAFLVSAFLLTTPTENEPVRRAGRAALPAAVLVLITEMVRLVYFGDWVPNTFHAKAALAVVANIGLGASSLWSYLSIGGFAFVALAAAALWWTRNDRARLCVAMAAPAFLAYNVAVGGSSGSPSRFFAPLILVLLGVIPWKEAGGAARRLQTLLIAVVLAGALVMIVSAKRIARETESPTTFELVSQAVHALPAGTSVVFQAIGLVGWENTHLVLIDPLGLTNREVALRGEPHPEVPIQGHRKWMTADQFFAARADYYVPFTAGSIKRGRCPDDATFSPTPSGPDSLVMGDPRLLRDYDAVTLQAPGIGCVLAFKRRALSSNQSR